MTTPALEAFFGLESRWLETAEGERTHFHDLGAGTPVVFLHGSGAGVSAAANWWLNLPSIGTRARTIALDMIGFGQTVVGDSPVYGVRAWGAHVLRLLDGLGIERAWLVGNSLGGWVALQLAIDHPERVLGVISMGTGGAARKTAALASHAAPDISIDGIRAVLEDFVVDSTLVTDELVEARYVAAQVIDAQERFAAVIDARERDRRDLPLDEDALKKLPMPVLLIHGREDSVIPPERSWRLSQLIPDVEMHLFSHCGHWSQVECADRFNTVVMDYLDARGVAEA
jgi:2-hydroxymuconate-semialdehyde hydrolase